MVKTLHSQSGPFALGLRLAGRDGAGRGVGGQSDYGSGATAMLAIMVAMNQAADFGATPGCSTSGPSTRITASCLPLSTAEVPTAMPADVNSLVLDGNLIVALSASALQQVKSCALAVPSACASPLSPTPAKGWPQAAEEALCTGHGRAGVDRARVCRGARPADLGGPVGQHHCAPAHWRVSRPPEPRAD